MVEYSIKETMIFYSYFNTSILCGKHELQREKNIYAQVIDHGQKHHLYTSTDQEFISSHQDAPFIRK